MALISHRGALQLKFHVEVRGQRFKESIWLLVFPPCWKIHNAQQIKCFVQWLLLAHLVILHDYPSKTPWDKTAFMWTRTLKVLMIIFKIAEIRTVCMFVTQLNESKLSNNICLKNKVWIQCSALVLTPSFNWKYQIELQLNLKCMTVRS